MKKLISLFAFIGALLFAGAAASQVLVVPRLVWPDAPTVTTNVAGVTRSYGTKFHVNVPSYYIGMRLYRSAGDTGTYTMRLYKVSDGSLVINGLMPNVGTPWSWMNANIPVFLMPGTDYMIVVVYTSTMPVSYVAGTTYPFDNPKNGGNVPPSDHTVTVLGSYWANISSGVPTTSTSNGYLIDPFIIPAFFGQYQ